MPIYEYRCDECGKVIEVFGQTAAQAEPPAQCKCGKTRSFTKLYSAFAAHSAGPAMPAGECCGGGACEDAPMSGGCCGGACGHHH